jgi:hypothetical protein
MSSTTLIQLFVFMLAGFVGVQTINRIPPLFAAFLFITALRALGRLRANMSFMRRPASRLET